MFNRLLTIISISLFVSASPIFAGFSEYSYSFTDPTGVQAGLGAVSVDGSTYSRASLSPNFLIGPVGIGFDLNIYIPLEEDGRLTNELNSVALRQVSYTHNESAGVKWGRLQQITMGYGLLVKNYDSGIGGNEVFTSKKAGFFGFADFQPLSFQTMYTGSEVFAGRVAYTTPFAPFYETPFVVGFTYAKDINGIDTQINDKQITRGEQEGYAIDLAFPVGGEFMTFFGEYAELNNHGKGAKLGVQGDLFDLIKYNAGYTRLGKTFVPGYFDQTYEVTNEPNGFTKEVNGFSAGAEMGFEEGKYRLGGEYERFDDHGVGTGIAGWTDILGSTGVMRYTVPFKGVDHAVFTSDISYAIGPNVDLGVQYKKVLITDSPIETWNFATYVHF